MRHLFSLPCLILLLAPAHALPQEAPTIPEDLQQTYGAFAAAMVRGDAERAVEFYAEDAVVLVDHEHVYRGRPAIREGFLVDYLGDAPGAGDDVPGTEIGIDRAVVGEDVVTLAGRYSNRTGAARDSCPSGPPVHASRDIGPPEAILEEMKSLKSRLLDRWEDRIDRIVLHGSRATGDARPDSDFDLLVVYRDGLSRREARRRFRAMRSTRSGRWPTSVPPRSSWRMVPRPMGGRLPTTAGVAVRQESRRRSRRSAGPPRPPDPPGRRTGLGSSNRAIREDP